MLYEMNEHEILEQSTYNISYFVCAVLYKTERCLSYKGQSQYERKVFNSGASSVMPPVSQVASLKVQKRTTNTPGV